MELTEQQFEVVATLLRSRSLSREAAKMVLVEEQRPCDVARKLDVSPVLIAVSLGKYRKAIHAIEAAWEIKR